jgi:hypothetical protein
MIQKPAYRELNFLQLLNWLWTAYIFGCLESIAEGRGLTFFQVFVIMKIKEIFAHLDYLSI